MVEERPAYRRSPSNSPKGRIKDKERIDEYSTKQYSGSTLLPFGEAGRGFISNYINGQLVAPQSGQYIDVFNPAEGKVMVLEKRVYSIRKFAILLLLLCGSFKGYSQLYLKGIAWTLPISAGGVIGAIEVRYRQLAGEVMVNRYEFHGEDNAEVSDSFQGLIKWYPHFRRVSDSTSRMNYYLAPFFRFTKSAKTHMVYNDSAGQNGPYVYYDGIKGVSYGPGLMLGSNIDFSKHFGMELGIYYYTLYAPSSFNGGSRTYTSHTYESHIGARIYLYLKMLKKHFR